MKPNSHRIPPQRVVGIDSARKFSQRPDSPPEPTAPAGHRPNQYTRRSFVNMVLMGAGFRQVVKTCKPDGATEANVIETLREELIRGGSLSRMKEAA